MIIPAKSVALYPTIQEPYDDKYVRLGRRIDVAGDYAQ
jgi:hypothetical protein